MTGSCKRAEEVFAVAVQCWHHSDLHCLFCYDDDELHLTSCDRESLLQSWQKEKREFSGASTCSTCLCTAEILWARPAATQKKFLLWLCNVGIILIYIAFSATTTTNFILRLVIESHCCKAGRKKKGSSAELQHIYIYIIYIYIHVYIGFCPPPCNSRKGFTGFVFFFRGFRSYPPLGWGQFPMCLYIYIINIYISV